MRCLTCKQSLVFIIMTALYGYIYISIYILLKYYSSRGHSANYHGYIH
uniref:Uncharacterized protein n=1 Tax=Anguilla anguilla TaxID=7936 RepID=A0A0E9QTC5_ANGAN